ncbi:hypothetical protein [Streptomyces sp. NPDC060184]|uniref:hypothetical protein n=1 Tax=Streptomyces sp. NPDC060184 TaxID=3347064 RepID=UPI00365909AA
MQEPHLELVGFLGDFESLAAEVAKGTARGASGEWSQAYVDAMRSFMSGEGADYVSGLRDTAAQIAEGAGEFAYQLDYTNLMIVLQVLAFLVEWAITLIMWEWNPIGAAIEQGILLDIFEFLFGSTLRKFLTHAAMSVVTNVALMSALDGLARWILAARGEHTAFGDQYRRSSVLSGAVQGAVGGALPLVTGPLKKLVSRAYMPAATKSIREAVDDALRGPGAVAPVRNDAVDVAGGGGGGAAGGKSAVGGGGKETGVLAPWDRDLADLGSWFGGALAELTVPMRVGLLHGGAGREAGRAFVDAVGDRFESAFASRLGPDTARRMGTDYASAFLSRTGPRGLARALRDALGPLESLGEKYRPLRSALSDGVAAAMPRGWKERMPRFGIDTVFSVGGQNLSEGIVNQIETGRFTTTFGTAAGAVGGELIGRAKHPVLAGVHATFKHTLGSGFKLPGLSLPALLNTARPADFTTVPPLYTPYPAAGETTLAGTDGGIRTPPPTYTTGTQNTVFPPSYDSPSYDSLSFDSPSYDSPSYDSLSFDTPAFGRPVTLDSPLLQHDNTLRTTGLLATGHQQLPTTAATPASAQAGPGPGGTVTSAAGRSGERTAAPQRDPAGRTPPAVSPRITTSTGAARGSSPHGGPDAGTAQPAQHSDRLSTVFAGDSRGSDSREQTPAEVRETVRDAGIRAMKPSASLPHESSGPVREAAAELTDPTRKAGVTEAALPSGTRPDSSDGPTAVARTEDRATADRTTGARDATAAGPGVGTPPSGRSVGDGPASDGVVSTTPDKGKGRATEPPAGESVLTRPLGENRPWSVEDAEALLDLMRAELGDHTYRQLALQASGLTRAAFDTPISLDGGLADTEPAVHAALVEVMLILAQHQHDPDRALDLAVRHLRTVGGGPGPFRVPRVPGGAPAAENGTRTGEAGASSDVTARRSSISTGPGLNPYEPVVTVLPDDRRPSFEPDHSRKNPPAPLPDESRGPTERGKETRSGDNVRVATPPRSAGAVPPELAARLMASGFMDVLVTREALAGVSYDTSLDAMWDLAPDAPVSVREAGLSPVDQANLLLTRPHLDQTLAAEVRTLLPSTSRQSPAAPAEHVRRTTPAEQVKHGKGKERAAGEDTRRQHDESGTGSLSDSQQRAVTLLTEAGAHLRPVFSVGPDAPPEAAARVRAQRAANEEIVAQVADAIAADDMNRAKRLAAGYAERLPAGPGLFGGGRGGEQPVAGGSATHADTGWSWAPGNGLGVSAEAVTPGIQEAAAAVASIGGRLVNVDGDGDCLFNAFIVARDMRDETQRLWSAARMREDVANRLREMLSEPQSTIWHDLGLQSLDERSDLIAAMATPGRWNDEHGDVFPYLLAEVYGVTIEFLPFEPGIDPEDWQQFGEGEESVSMVRFNPGPGFQHWAAVLPRNTTAPAQEPAPQRTPSVAPSSYRALFTPESEDMRVDSSTPEPVGLALPGAATTVLAHQRDAPFAAGAVRAPSVIDVDSRLQQSLLALGPWAQHPWSGQPTDHRFGFARHGVHNLNHEQEAALFEALSSRSGAEPTIGDVLRHIHATHGFVVHEGDLLHLHQRYHGRNAHAEPAPQQPTDPPARVRQKRVAPVPRPPREPRPPRPPREPQRVPTPPPVELPSARLLDGVPPAERTMALAAGAFVAEHRGVRGLFTSLGPGHLPEPLGPWAGRVRKGREQIAPGTRDYLERLGVVEPLGPPQTHRVAAAPPAGRPAMPPPRERFVQPPPPREGFVQPPPPRERFVQPPPPLAPHRQAPPPLAPHRQPPPPQAPHRQPPPVRTPHQNDPLHGVPPQERAMALAANAYVVERRGAAGITRNAGRDAPMHLGSWVNRVRMGTITIHQATSHYLQQRGVIQPQHLARVRHHEEQPPAPQPVLPPAESLNEVAMSERMMALGAGEYVRTNRGARGITSASGEMLPLHLGTWVRNVRGGREPIHPRTRAYLLSLNVLRPEDLRVEVYDA